MPRFKLPTVPQTTSKSIRFPNDVIEGVERCIQGKDCTFTAFVVEAVRVAIATLREDEQGSGNACPGHPPSGKI